MKNFAGGKELKIKSIFFINSVYVWYLQVHCWISGKSDNRETVWYPSCKFCLTDHSQGRSPVTAVGHTMEMINKNHLLMFNL